MPHQRDVIERLGNGKILYGEVGIGKSVAVMGYYIEKEAPRDIYVITTAKKRDSLEWVRDAALVGVGRKPDETTAGILTIDSWNNIGKYAEVEDAFFVFDEQRLVGSGTWVKYFLRIAKANRWVLLTATPGDTWLDYIPVFVANGLYRNIGQFKREHVIYQPYIRYPKVVGYIGEEQLEKYRNMILVEMLYSKHTHRNLEWVETSYDPSTFDKVYKSRWHVYEDRPIKDVGELFRVMRRVVNSDESRAYAIQQLLKRHPKIIVYYNFDYELEILRDFAAEVAVAEWNGHRKEPIPDADSWLYLVQYVSGAEGWNCTDTDCVVFYSLTYSYKNFEQAQGRIDRLNSPFTELWYYILATNSFVDRAIRSALDKKELFNERRWWKEFEALERNWPDLSRGGT
jgi:hypothetical protein